MEEESGTGSVAVDVPDPPILAEEVPNVEPKTETNVAPSDVCDRNESGVGGSECSLIEEARSLELERLATSSAGEAGSAGEEAAAAGPGSDSGVEGCGRALSSAGGSRSCASSVVSCGSESSSGAAPPRPRRRVSVAAPEPRRPPTTSTPRGPNLATKERARSREKPAIPEKPRPLTPKPRIRPAPDLPHLVRESPALRAKPTKTSTARCRTPSSPAEDVKRWPSASGPRPGSAESAATRLAADKYGTVPRRRRDDADAGSPRHETTPPASRRPTVTRSASSRVVTKTRVRIYAEKTMQTVLLGTDIEAAFAGKLPDVESRGPVSKCERGVQCSARGEAARLAAAAAGAAEERARRARLEEQLAEERAARRAALHELDRNSLRLLELAGAGAGANADGCLRALEEQLTASRELAARQQAEIDALRQHCDTLHAEACGSAEKAASLTRRLAEAEREAAEMQDFLAAETGALADSLREAELQLHAARLDLDKRRTECRQLVRMCEQRRQESLAAAARGAAGGGAARALRDLTERVAAVSDALARAYRLPHSRSDVYSRSDSGDALTPEDEPLPRGGLLAAVTKALRIAMPPAAHPAPPPPHPAPPADVSHASDDNDNSADLLDSETEPCLVTDPECVEEWWSGAEGAEGADGAGAWSGDELSPVRDCASLDDSSASRRDPRHPADPASDRDSLLNLSNAIYRRQAAEESGSLQDKVIALDARLTELLRAIAFIAASKDDPDSVRLAALLREKTECPWGDADGLRGLAERDNGKNLHQYRHSMEMLKNQVARPAEEDDLEILEEEAARWAEGERRERYEALDAALAALHGRPRAAAWPRLAALQRALERLAFAVAAAPAAPAAPAPAQLTNGTPLHTTA